MHQDVAWRKRYEITDCCPVKPPKSTISSPKPGRVGLRSGYCDLEGWKRTAAIIFDDNLPAALDVYALLLGFALWHLHALHVIDGIVRAGSYLCGIDARDLSALHGHLHHVAVEQEIRFKIVVIFHSHRLAVDGDTDDTFIAVGDNHEA